MILEHLDIDSIFQFSATSQFFPFRTLESRALLTKGTYILKKKRSQLFLKWKGILFKYYTIVHFYFEDKSKEMITSYHKFLASLLLSSFYCSYDMDCHLKSNLEQSRFQPKKKPNGYSLLPRSLILILLNRKMTIVSARAFSLPKYCHREMEHVIVSLLTNLTFPIQQVQWSNENILRRSLGLDAFIEQVVFGKLERINGKKELDELNTWAIVRDWNFEGIDANLREALVDKRAMVWVDKVGNKVYPHVQFLVIGKEKGYVLKFELAEDDFRGPYMPK